VVVKLIRRNGLAPFPFLLALATSANIGSVATLVGNPQNMLCGHLGNLTYSGYLAVMGPVAVAGLAANHLLLRVLFRNQLRGNLVPDPGETAVTVKMALTLAVLFGTVVLFLLGANLAWTAVAGFTLLFFIHKHDSRKIWANIDWSILLFFAGLFVVVEGLFHSGAVDWVFHRFPLPGLDPGVLPFVFLAGSNVVSNVPFILVVQGQIAAFPDPKPVWELLAMASTFGGNLTLIGSVANIIVAEKAREIGGMGFWEYLRVGFPLAVLTTVMGFAWLSYLYPAF
jgi:Na+/H+ antiporter NhaD/arsenite permease-like protein